MAIGWLWWSGPVSAVSNDDYYRSGWVLYQDGRYQEAASLWQAQARSGVYPDDVARRQAAFAGVLAARAWEKAENANAYGIWADAIRLYLEAGVSWEQERQKLSERVAEARQALQHTTEPPTLESFILLLLTIDSESGLADYHGPHPGLTKPGSEELTGVQLNYQPMPFAAPVDSRPAPLDVSVGAVSEDVQEVPHAASQLNQIVETKVSSPVPADVPAVPAAGMDNLSPLIAQPATLAPANVYEPIVQPAFSGHVIPELEPQGNPISMPVVSPAVVRPTREEAESPGKKRAAGRGKRP